MQVEIILSIMLLTLMFTRLFYEIKEDLCLKRK